jgi:hypothetical protein
VSHRCPRPECDRKVSDDQYACRGDWYALPEVIRTKIWRAWRSGDTAAHMEAMGEALEWYHAHPPGGAGPADRPGVITG